MCNLAYGMYHVLKFERYALAVFVTKFNRSKNCLMTSNCVCSVCYHYKNLTMEKLEMNFIIYLNVSISTIKEKII